MKKDPLFSFKFLVYDFIRITALPGILWFRPKKYYMNPNDKQVIKGGALVISNHITLFDPMYLMLLFKSRRHHCICMEELFEKNKLKRWLFTKCFYCLPINREKPGFEQIKDIINSLKKGRFVTMFPEGKVNEDKSQGVQSFKSGMVVMAMRGNAPIYPVYIKRRMHFFSRLEAAVGSPVDVTKYKAGSSATPEEINTVVRLLEEKEKELEQFFKEKK